MTYLNAVGARHQKNLRGAFVAAVVTMFGCQAGATLAQETLPESGADQDEYVTVLYGPETSLRDMAKQYLDDPDLWPIILRLNGLEDITDIEDNQELRLPASQLQAAISGLATSLALIQSANEAGAQLFAPLLISAAIKLRDDAVREKQEGDYSLSINLSTQSIDRAETAKVKSDEQRDVKAEARLSDRHGWVEGQKIEENSWSERMLNSVLNEQEKLRTLSESTAQVVFRDASRLRLNPNSQAVIQRMRVDPLKRREEAQISLIEGDFYALLATESKRNRLEVSLPNADAKIDSGSFWVSQDTDSAKFSNYDVKPVSISAGGETLVLGRNEGALVRAGEAPREKVEVHRRIALGQPDDEALLFGEQVELSWEAGDGGTEYWVEVAFDPRFDRMAESLWGLTDNRVEALAVNPGVYFWRVAAIDPFGLPGQMSTVRRFEVRTDTVPPFLQIDSPAPDAILRKAEVEIRGEIEPDASLTIDGVEVSADASGIFSHVFTATAGNNVVAIITSDPAGNVTEREIAFRYMEDDAREIEYDADLVRDADGRFLSAGQELTISGKVVENARVTILDSDGASRSETFADASGTFLLNLPLKQDEETFTVRVETASGHSFDESIQSQILNEAPQITYASPPPAVTSYPKLALDILVNQGAVLTVNGKAADQSGDRAQIELELSQGPNLVETVATNAVGLVTIDKRTVIFDSMKPDVTTQSVSVQPSGDKELVTLRVGAKDATGVAKTSRYRVQIGDQEYRGVLRFNRARKAYQGKTEVPLRMNNETLTIEVEIADVAGNINVVTLTQ